MSASLMSQEQLLEKPTRSLEKHRVTLYESADMSLWSQSLTTENNGTVPFWNMTYKRCALCRPTRLATNVRECQEMNHNYWRQWPCFQGVAFAKQLPRCPSDRTKTHDNWDNQNDDIAHYGLQNHRWTQKYKINLPKCDKLKRDFPRWVITAEQPSVVA